MKGMKRSMTKETAIVTKDAMIRLANFTTAMMLTGYFIYNMICIIYPFTFLRLIILVVSIIDIFLLA